VSESPGEAGMIGDGSLPVPGSPKAFDLGST
jgi:hypothetical protein